MKPSGLRLLIAFVALFAASTAFAWTVPADAETESAHVGRPLLQPGWPEQGSLHVDGCKVNRDNPECEVSRNGPFGEITMRSRFIPAFTPLGRERATLGWDTCYSDWRGGYPSYWFEMWTPWSYDYSTVTAMNSTYHDHAVPLFVWSDQDAYNDW